MLYRNIRKASCPLPLVLSSVSMQTVVYRMVKTEDTRDPKLSLAASGIWSGEYWFPDSSIDVQPPLLTSRSSTIIGGANELRHSICIRTVSS